MPVCLVNGSPNAVMADFFQTPPNTKAVTGGSAACAVGRSAGRLASSADPANARPSGLEQLAPPEPAGLDQHLAQARAGRVDVHRSRLLGHDIP